MDREKDGQLDRSIDGQIERQDAGKIDSIDEKEKAKPIKKIVLVKQRKT